MKLKDMRFRVKQNGQEIVFGWKQIWGYEGEVCGVFATDKDNQCKGTVTLTNNSGYGFKGINEDLEIEVFEEKENADE